MTVLLVNFQWDKYFEFIEEKISKFSRSSGNITNNTVKNLISKVWFSLHKEIELANHMLAGGKLYQIDYDAMIRKLNKHSGKDEFVKKMLQEKIVAKNAFMKKIEVYQFHLGKCLFAKKLLTTIKKDFEKSMAIKFNINQEYKNWYVGDLEVELLKNHLMQIKKLEDFYLMEERLKALSNTIKDEKIKWENLKEIFCNELNAIPDKLNERASVTRVAQDENNDRPKSIGMQKIDWQRTSVDLFKKKISRIDMTLKEMANMENQGKEAYYIMPAKQLYPSRMELRS